jgi:hypothetical protein
MHNALQAMPSDSILIPDIASVLAIHDVIFSWAVDVEIFLVPGAGCITDNI